MCEERRRAKGARSRPRPARCDRTETDETDDPAPVVASLSPNRHGFTGRSPGSRYRSGGGPTARSLPPPPPPRGHKCRCVQKNKIYTNIDVCVCVFNAYNMNIGFDASQHLYFLMHFSIL